MKQNLKQKLVSWARNHRLLPVLERFRFVQYTRQCMVENFVFRRDHPTFKPPSIWWMHDMYGNTSYKDYFRTGGITARHLTEQIEKYAPPGPIHIVDWGCGLGRVIRQLPDHFTRSGFDPNRDAIHWCQQNIPDIDFQTSPKMPPLPLADQSVDVVLALSVFTHLSKSGHQSWIDEIERILRPGGLMIGSFHLNPAPGHLTPALQAQFDQGKLVVCDGVEEGSRLFTAHHPEKFVTQSLLQNFDILEPPAELLGQTLFVARMKP